MPIFQEVDQVASPAPSTVVDTDAVQPMGPPVPGLAAALPPGGLTGRARFEAEVKGSIFGANVWGHDFNQWILSLKEDPNDPEYNLALRWAQGQAKQKESGTASSIGKVGKQVAKGGTLPQGFKVPDEVIADQKAAIGSVDLPGGQGPAGVEPSGSQIIGGPLSDDATGRPDGLSRFDQKVEQEQHVADVKQSKKPVFRGRQVGTDELYQPVGPLDAYLDAWLSENGIALEGNSKTIALRSGKYVYMGTEHNSELNTDHDVYTYVEDASAAGVNPAVVEPALIQQYQAALGFTVTGRMDPYLMGKWDEAVSQAQRYAMTGVKMSVKELFVVLMSSIVAQKKAQGGSGAAQMEEFDYYRSMMQVLGDISGVDNA